MPQDRLVAVRCPQSIPGFVPETGLTLVFQQTPSSSNIPSYGPDDAYSNTGGVYSVKNYPLGRIIAFAYKSNSAQGQALIDSWPPWVLSDRVDIEARSELHDATKD